MLARLNFPAGAGVRPCALVVFVAALALSACGGGSDDGDAPEPSTLPSAAEIAARQDLLDGAATASLSDTPTESEIAAMQSALDGGVNSDSGGAVDIDARQAALDGSSKF